MGDNSSEVMVNTLSVARPD